MNNSINSEPPLTDAQIESCRQNGFALVAGFYTPDIEREAGKDLPTVAGAAFSRDSFFGDSYRGWKPLLRIAATTPRWLN